MNFNIIIYSNVFNLICRVLCVLGCIYQTYKISVLYFSYQTSTNVNYVPQMIDHKTHPAITFCMYTSDAIKIQYPDNYSSYYMYNKSINERFQVFSTLKHKFSCLVTTNKFYVIDCKSLAKYTESLNDMIYCLTILPDALNENFFRTELSLSLTGVRIMFYKSMPIKNDVLLNIRDSPTRIYDPFPRGQIYFKYTNTTKVTMKYRKTILKYKPSHFRNRCFTKHKTYDECYYVCIKRTYLNKHIPLLRNYLVFN